MARLIWHEYTQMIGQQSIKSTVWLPYPSRFGVWDNAACAHIQSNTTTHWIIHRILSILLFRWVRRLGAVYAPSFFQGPFGQTESVFILRERTTREHRENRFETRRFKYFMMIVIILNDCLSLYLVVDYPCVSCSFASWRHSDLLSKTLMSVVPSLAPIQCSRWDWEDGEDPVSLTDPIDWARAQVTRMKLQPI